MLLCFFKRKTAYEMRISDWSSDVCSSDLLDAGRGRRAAHDPAHRLAWLAAPDLVRVRAAQPDDEHHCRNRFAVAADGLRIRGPIGSASCREGVCQYG